MAIFWFTKRAKVWTKLWDFGQCGAPGSETRSFVEDIHVVGKIKARTVPKMDTSASVKFWASASSWDV